VQSRIRVVVMAPKPKSRKVDALPAPAQSVSEIGNLNKKVASLVEDLHSRRFETADSKLEPLPWPLLHGGTLKEEWPPQVGSMFGTHILQWSMDDNSFWKGFVPCSEVIGVAMAIARSRMREAGDIRAIPQNLANFGGWANPFSWRAPPR
ncbi:unnamed protein product, partial [Durusdinium trenchii]